MPTDILSGAEPFDATGGPYGALVLHGFTGTPLSVRGVAESLAGAGLAVSAPLLPGHGTAMDDMLTTGWDDWYGAAEEAYLELAASVDKVVVVGLSMGGTLAVALGADHPEASGLAVVNPYVDPPAESFRDLLRGLLDQGVTVAPGAGSDIAEPTEEHLSYEGTPLRPLLTLCEALDLLATRLPDVTCPLLIMTSRVDHVVPPVSSDVLAEAVSGPVERVWLERSFHMATLDADREDVERRTVGFARKVLG